MAEATEIKPEHSCLVETTRQAIQEERQIQAELEILQRKMKQLRRNAKKLERRAEALEPSIATTVLEYAKSECQKLCDAIYRTFPREIRDMIYSHIHLVHDKLTFISYNSIPWDNAPVTYFESTSESHYRTGHNMKHEQHLWDADFMGVDILKELVASYFRSRTFDFDQDWHHIPDFRTKDQWKLDLVPADFVTNIQVVLQCENHKFGSTWIEDDTSSIDTRYGANKDGWMSGACGGWGAVEEYMAPKVPYSELLPKLEYLFGFKKGTSINFRMLKSRRCKVWDCQTTCMRDFVVPLILPTLHRLEAFGCKVNFQITRNDPRVEDFYFNVETAAPDMETFKREFAKLEVAENQRLEEIKEDGEAYSISQELAAEDERGDAFAGFGDDDQSEED